MFLVEFGGWGEGIEKEECWGVISYMAFWVYFLMINNIFCVSDIILESFSFFIFMIVLVDDIYVKG